MRRALQALWAGALLWPSAAGAADTTKPIADGVTMLTRTTSKPLVIHVLTIDLTVPGVHLGATATGERKRTTSSWAKLVTARAAINGDLFNASYATTGLAAGKGAAWPDTKDTKSSALIAFDDGSRVQVHPAAEITAFDAVSMRGVVSGHPQVVTAGVALATDPVSPVCPTPNPRTAVGLSQDGKTAFLAVIDGRSSASVGMKCTEVGGLMKSLGAYDAIDLDGGGSTTMYVRGTGIVNKPSEGSERIVANHLAVYAPALGSIGSVSGVVFAEPDHANVLEGARVAIQAVGEDTTDATGVYTLDTLPGTATITAMRPGYAVKSVDVDIAAGADVKLDLGMTADPNADFDKDGVLDGKDVCPEIADPDQKDTDGDGKGDACDGDDDGDGLADEDDNCPLVSNANQADANHDGVGDACPPSASASSGGAAPAAEDGCSLGAATRPPSTPILFGALVLAAAVVRRFRMSRRSKRDIMY